MRPLTPGIVAVWVFIGLLAFGPPLNLPALELPSLFGPPAGPRSAVIVRESFDDTPALAQLWKNLQGGDAEKYLASKHHTVTILDDDETGSDNQPLPFLVKYGLAGKMANGQHTPPELLLFTADMKRLLVRQTLTPDATADSVLATFKAHGG